MVQAYQMHVNFVQIAKVAIFFVLHVIFFTVEDQYSVQRFIMPLDQTGKLLLFFFFCKNHFFDMKVTFVYRKKSISCHIYVIACFLLWHL